MLINDRLPYSAEESISALDGINPALLYSTWEHKEGKMGFDILVVSFYF